MCISKSSNRLSSTSQQEREQYQMQQVFFAPNTWLHPERGPWEEVVKDQDGQSASRTTWLLLGLGRCQLRQGELVPSRVAKPAWDIAGAVYLLS